jgi:ceramide glucosyltransferase
VTLIKPLKGIDTALEENLKNCFIHNHAPYEIIFCVADKDDEAIPIVQKLIKNHPLVDARLLCGNIVLISEEGANVGVNPKVNNILQAYMKAKYDLLWIIDSNIQVDPNTMSRSAALFEYPDIGLVHHLPIGINPETFGSALEASYLNLNHAKIYTTANYLNVASCVNGKSNMYRKSDIEKMGGLAQFGKYLAEDNVIGQHMLRFGRQHAMTGDLARQPLGSLTLMEFIKRRIRWIRLRKYVATLGTLYEPWTECFLSGFVGGTAFNYFFQIPFLLFFSIHVFIWFLCDVLVMSTLEPKFLSSIGLYVTSWIIKETFAAPLWIAAMIGTKVEWRGKHFILNWDGTVSNSSSKVSRANKFE